MSQSGATLGIVVIGRNEGERLRRCLASCLTPDHPVVYVDSGSGDHSLQIAQGFGVEVVRLDPARPFTAARARNEGFARLLQLWPGLEFVQFVDGDCEVASGWLVAARDALVRHPRTAVVCGRRREQAPGASLYNWLADLEWNTPVGPAESCGGDALVRAVAFGEVCGYDGSFIAGEEPEMCFRLRERGWQILRIDAEMTRHDAAMFMLRQWWQRARRAGHAYTETLWRYGARSRAIGMIPVVSALAWSGFAVLAVLAAALVHPLAGAALAAIYPLQWVRIARRKRIEGLAWRESLLYAGFILLAKFAHVHGALTFIIARLRRRRQDLIEYKTAVS